MKAWAVIMLGLFYGLNAYADETKNNILLQKTNGRYIHTTEIKTNKKSIEGFIILNVGKTDKDQCQPEREVLSSKIEFKDGLKIVLNGEALAHKVGVDYTCAQEVFRPYHGPSVMIGYAIFNDGKIYNKADPDYQKATIHG